ncbi:hypothetical protein GCM10023063_00200 [Arthrobacter methylotrophus]
MGRSPAPGAQQRGQPGVGDDPGDRSHDEGPRDVEIVVAAVPRVLDAEVQSAPARHGGVEAAKHPDFGERFRVRGSLMEPAIVVYVEGQDQVPLTEPLLPPAPGYVLLGRDAVGRQDTGGARIDGVPGLV